MTFQMKFTNPYKGDPDKEAIWEGIVRRDAEAFVANDWSITSPDFCEEEFYGIDAEQNYNPNLWKMKYPTLASYRDEWLRQRNDFDIDDCKYPLYDQLMSAMFITDIEINGDRAIVRKKFDGQIALKSKEDIPLKWQTLYYFKKFNGKWLITGFTGYLPFNMKRNSDAVNKKVPQGAGQHVTAGPYSPVLEVKGSKLVVISGQAAIVHDGSVVGETIEEQTELTIANCREQLEKAGAGLSDVFKVNVYLTDLDEWPRFNEVYSRMMPEPRPVRTAVQTGLLMTLKVEIEMWAMIN